MTAKPCAWLAEMTKKLNLIPSIFTFVSSYAHLALALPFFLLTYTVESGT